MSDSRCIYSHQTANGKFKLHDTKLGFTGLMLVGDAINIANFSQLKKPVANDSGS